MTTRAEDVEECYRLHADALSRFAVSLTGTGAGDDVLATAVLSVLESNTEQIDDLRAYLYRAVHNAARKHWRTAGRRAARERQLWAATQYEMPEVDLGVASALASMSVMQRAVVHLAYWEDLTTAQIAARLGVREGTVKQHRSRAHRRLGEVLDDHR